MTATVPRSIAGHSFARAARGRSSWTRSAAASGTPHNCTGTSAPNGTSAATRPGDCGHVTPTGPRRGSSAIAGVCGSRVVTTETGLGWCSPCYGAVVPTCAARVTRTARAPFDIVTWIGTGQEKPSLERVHPETDPSSNAVGVRVVQDDTARVTLIRPGEPAVREGRSGAIADYHTNARLLHYAMRGNALAAIAIADATQVLSLREGLLSLAADDHIDDLHLSIVDGVMELVASRPLARLHLQGAALTHVVLVTLNGRELHLPAGGPRGCARDSRRGVGGTGRTCRPRCIR